MDRLVPCSANELYTFLEPTLGAEQDDYVKVVVRSGERPAILVVPRLKLTAIRITLSFMINMNAKEMLEELWNPGTDPATLKALMAHGVEVPLRPGSAGHVEVALARWRAFHKPIEGQEANTELPPIDLDKLWSLVDTTQDSSPRLAQLLRRFGLSMEWEIQACQVSTTGLVKPGALASAKNSGN